MGGGGTRGERRGRGERRWRRGGGARRIEEAPRGEGARLRVARVCDGLVLVVSEQDVAELAVWQVLDDHPPDREGTGPLVLRPRAKLLGVVDGGLHLRHAGELARRVDLRRGRVGGTAPEAAGQGGVCEGVTRRKRVRAAVEAARGCHREEEVDWAAARGLAVRGVKPAVACREDGGSGG